MEEYEPGMTAEASGSWDMGHRRTGMEGKG